jgi:uncharacterized protein
MLSPIDSRLRHPAARVALSLLLALMAALVCVRIGTPLPWMIGPLLATAALAMLGGPAQSYVPFRNGGQWVVGVALGLYFTPQVVRLVLGLWWEIALGIVWAVALGWFFGLYLQRVHAGPGRWHIPGLTRTTTYFASPIGAASEMTLMAERRGAQTELVASAHSLRVLMVTLVIPFGLQWSGLQGLDINLPGTRETSWPGLCLLALLSGTGCAVMLWLKRTNAWFLGGLLVTMLLTANNVSLSAMPVALVSAAQLVIGVSLGVRFSARFVRMAPRWLVSVAFATVVMMALSAGFAVVIARFTQIHPATLLLGTAPGGIAEMSITAKVLQLGVPVVTAFQVTRLAAVLMLTEPLYRWRYGAAVQGT